MRWWLLVLGWAVGAAYGQQTCLRWVAVELPGQMFMSAESAASAVCAAAPYPVVGAHPVEGSYSGEALYFFYCKGRLADCEGDDEACGYKSRRSVSRISTTNCSVICDTSRAGERFTASGEGSSAPASICDTVSGCIARMDGVSVAAGGSWGGSYKVTAEACEDQVPEVRKQGEQCVFAGTIEICHNPSGEGQCGYINDEFVCIKSVPKGGCVGLADGSMVCEQTAGSPPAPDNGTRGEVATPDGQFSAGWSTSSGSGSVTNTYNYFTSATVSGSSQQPGTSGGTVYHPPGGSGSDGGDSGSGDGSCPEGADCSGNLPGGGELEEVDSFGELTDAFWQRVKGAPLVEAVSDLGQSVPAGACPDLSFEVFGQQVNLAQSMCSIWDSIAPILAAAMLVAWGLLATRIVLSA